MENCAEIATDHSVEAAEQPPVIDLSGMDGPERRQIGQKVAKACETWGFFQITNHGVDESLIERTKEVFTQFFQLPLQEKLKHEANIADRATYAYQGYSYPSCDGHILANSTEHLYNVYGTGVQAVINRQPSNPPLFRSTVAEYVEALDVLVGRLLGLMSEELGLPRETLPQYTMEKIHGIRANYYQPTQRNDKNCTVPAHTDVAALTLLLSNDAPGTQIKKDSRWVQIDLAPCSFLVNVADQTEILSNGRYKSVEHRGLPHETQHRLTIGTFTSPRPTTLIGPLPELLDKSHPPLYKTQPYADYLAKFFQQGFNSKTILQTAKLSTPDPNLHN